MRWDIVDISDTWKESARSVQLNNNIVALIIIIIRRTNIEMGTIFVEYESYIEVIILA